MENALVVLPLVLVVFILKGTIASLATAILKYPPRTVLLTGLALFQIGEFAFILSRVGIKAGLLTDEMNQYFLSVSIVTMLFTPFVIQYSDKISAVLINSRLQKKWGVIRSKYDTKENEDVKGIENHLVIIGYGINGTNVAKAARYAKIPYVILELNADVVRFQKARGEPIVFGDAVHEHILNTVRLKNARVVVVAISDPKATKLIVSNIRNISQTVYVVVRTRYVKEMDTLIALGADEVIPEEFETSIEIFTRVLHNYLVPIDEMQNLIDSIRADNYNLFLPQGRSPKNIVSTRIPDFKISCVRLLADSGSIIGKTIAETNVRKKFGVNILAISRKGHMISSIKPNEKMIQNDLVFITGDQEHIESFYNAVS